LDKCVKQINQARKRLKDVVANAKEHMTQYKVKLATLIVEHNHPHFCEGNDHVLVEKENLVIKVLKTRENYKPAKRSWKKLERQVRGVLKPEKLKRSRLVKNEVPYVDEWRKGEGREIMEEHIMEQNIEQLSHARKTPFGYSELGAESGHTGYSQMANDMLESTVHQECLSNEASRAIMNHLREHPVVQQK
jgi:hypothetical protein